MGFLQKLFASPSYSDAELLEGIRRANKDMLVYIFEEHYPKAGAFILKNGGRESDVGHVMHEVVVHFWHIAQDLEYDPPGPIGDVLAHSARSFWARKKGLDKETAMVENYLDIEVPIPEGEKATWIKRLNIIGNNFRLLSQKQKEILYLTYFEDWSDERIARLYEIDAKQILDIRLKAMDKFENILQGAYVKRDLIN